LIDLVTTSRPGVAVLLVVEIKDISERF